MNVITVRSYPLYVKQRASVLLLFPHIHTVTVTKLGREWVCVCIGGCCWSMSCCMFYCLSVLPLYIFIQVFIMIILLFSFFILFLFCLQVSKASSAFFHYFLSYEMTSILRYTYEVNGVLCVCVSMLKITKQKVQFFKSFFLFIIFSLSLSSYPFALTCSRYCCLYCSVVLCGLNIFKLKCC